MLSMYNIYHVHNLTLACEHADITNDHKTQITAETDGNIISYAGSQSKTKDLDKLKFSPEDCKRNVEGSF